MSWRKFTHRAAGWVLTVTLAACGGGGGGGGGGTDPGGNQGPDYFPLALNDRQLYDSPQEGEFETRVASTRSIGGRVATVVRNTYLSDGFSFDQYVVRDANGVHLIPGPGADAFERAVGDLTLLRFPVVAGDSFTYIDRDLGDGIDVDGDGRADSVYVLGTLSVIGLETVSTASGTFAGAAHVRRVETFDVTFGGTTSAVRFVITTDDWYAPDVGLVRSEQRFTAPGVDEPFSFSIKAYAVAGRGSEAVAPAASDPRPAPGSQARFDAPLLVSVNEWMDSASLTAANAQITDSAGATVSGTWSLTPQQLRFVPSGGWPAGQVSVRLTSGVRDFAGNGLAQELSWSFTVDRTGPQLVSRSPLPGATDVPGLPLITATFSEAIDIVSSFGAVKLYRGNTEVASAAWVDGATVYLQPIQALERGAEHRVIIAGTVTDTQGNPLGQPLDWTFRTSPAVLQPASTLPFASSIEAVAIGDVTGDGRNDVVVATFFGGSTDDLRVFVLPQQADGSLGAHVSYATRATYGCHPTTLAIGDVNGDGRKDVVLGEMDCGFEILLQAADGTLADGGLRSNAPVYKARLVDLDADGRLDLVSLGWGTGQVQVWRGTASGLAVAPETYAIEHFGYEDLAVGDINADGRPDIVITSGQGETSKSLAILRQQPDGSFGNAEYREVDPVWGAWGVDIGDIDGDGRNDIVASWNGNAPTYLGVFRQQADGSLGAMQPIATYDIPSAVKIVDMDGDGRSDIVVTHRGWSTVGVYRQRSDGSLSEEDRYFAPINGFNPDHLDVGDVNGDGRPDVVAEASLLLGAGGATTAAQSRVLRPATGAWRPRLR
jgi:hypothetical protein